jgi:hypothetical protein
MKIGILCMCAFDCYARAEENTAAATNNAVITGRAYAEVLPFASLARG